MARKSYEDRLKGCDNQLVKKLYKIIIEKQSNLCVAANFDTFEEIVDFVERAGRHICVLKTQLEGILNNGSKPLDYYLKILYELKKKHNFLLFEDKKFYDLDVVIGKYYERTWVKYVDLVTLAMCHADSYFETFQSVIDKADLPLDEPRGVLSVCELSFKGSGQEGEDLLKVAERNSHTCAGIIAQKLNLSNQDSMLKFTPGIHLHQSTDGGNQNWNHPSKAIQNGADIVIVGRGITSYPKDKQEDMARLYKEMAYQAYCDQVAE